MSHADEDRDQRVLAIIEKALRIVEALDDGQIADPLERVEALQTIHELKHLLGERAALHEEQAKLCWMQLELVERALPGRLLALVPSPGFGASRS